MIRMPDGMPAIFRHFSHLVKDSVRGSLRSCLVLGSQTLLVFGVFRIELSNLLNLTNLINLSNDVIRSTGYKTKYYKIK